MLGSGSLREERIMTERRKQKSAPMTIPMGKEAFENREDTAVFWLGSGGFLINCRGFLVMIDPVTESRPGAPEISEAGFPFLVPSPITAEQVPRLDAILYTHADYDHMAPLTAARMKNTGAFYYGTACSVRTLRGFGIPKSVCRTLRIHESIRLGPIRIFLTAASHSWQKDRPEYDWCYGPEDCCGFLMETPDGVLWAPGDSILLEEHLQLPHIDAMFFDVSSDPFHFGTEASIRIANTYENADLLLYHYGTYDAPEKPAFNADPDVVAGRIRNEVRLHRTAPGEPFLLKKNS